MRHDLTGHGEHHAPPPLPHACSRAGGQGAAHASESARAGAGTSPEVAWCCHC
jgi:hypothetical protein